MARMPATSLTSLELPGTSCGRQAWGRSGQGGLGWSIAPRRTCEKEKCADDVFHSLCACTAFGVNLGQKGPGSTEHHMCREPAAFSRFSIGSMTHRSAQIPVFHHSNWAGMHRPQQESATASVLLCLGTLLWQVLASASRCMSCLHKTRASDDVCRNTVLHRVILTVQKRRDMHARHSSHT